VKSKDEMGGGEGKNRNKLKEEEKAKKIMPEGTARMGAKKCLYRSGHNTKQEGLRILKKGPGRTGGVNYIEP